MDYSAAIGTFVSGMAKARHLTLLLAVAGGALTTSEAAAQTTAQPESAPPADQSAAPAAPVKKKGSVTDEGSVFRDIIVTAQKRSENIQKVGISITAFSGSQMRQLGLRNAIDIAKVTPAVSIYQIHPSVTSINIRGVSQNYFADHLEAPIAVYQDDAYLGSTSSVGVRTYDVDRVEVLRGPQGTLFGRNATGGLIHFVSKGPTDKFDAYEEVTAGGYEYGHGFIETEGAVGGPLSDNVTARLSFATTNDQGPWHNSVGPAPGNNNEYDARLQLRWEIDPATRLDLNGSISLNRNMRGAAYTTRAVQPDAHGLGTALAPDEYGTYVNFASPTFAPIQSPCEGCDLTGYRQGSNPFKLQEDDPGSFRRTIYSGTAKLTHDFGRINFVSVSNYQHISKSFSIDTDGGPSVLFDYGTQMKYRQFSEEARVSGTSDKLKWVAGFFYLNMKGRYGVDGLFDLGPYIGLTCTAPACYGGSPVTDSLRASYELNVKSWSGFAQGDYYLTPDFYVTGGLRYTDDQKTFDYRFHDSLGFQAVLTGGSPTVDYNPATDPSADRSFKNISAKAQVNWTPSSNLLVYLGYSRANKGGNWSAPIFPPVVTSALPHKQEVLTSIEGGEKLRMLNGALTLNSSVYYYYYKNYQAFAMQNLVQTIFNVNARAYGGEVELRANPLLGLDLGLSTAFIHNTVYDTPLPDGTFADRKLPNAPKISLNGLLRYSFDALGGKLAAQANAQYFGAHYMTVLNEPTNHENGYVTVDLRLEYTSPDAHWSAAGFVRNANNARYRIYGLDVSSLSYAAGVYAPPRTYGMTLGWKY
ncbi:MULTISPECIES: TonB-dependent receptor [unclassified Sphingomonas]|uniref:TonB-dependent receptor n=1 Tax=unclassified Sphingomonas TaxID=196159 RepID=UPI0006FB9A80|nr:MULTISPECIES: TonB-dependent receptor [unclassified Sphingomonas]KRB78781.1 hypothetical protein ASE00_21365 [Sphingomonas sp. Root710]KRB93691.1 hypothetical protein ASE22_25135 [Sphingomonas sp. Root720]